MPVGVIVERRAIDNPWQDFSWRPVGVIPGAGQPAGDGWTVLESGDGWTRFHAATLPLELYARETEGYRVNLSNEPPHVYVVLRPDDEGEAEVAPFLVTACPFEAEGYDQSGDEIVQGVPMPAEMIGWIRDFVDRHHRDIPFKKRKNRPHDPRKGGAWAGGRPGP
ncbi:MAG: DUF3305 domain-containing protein [Rhodobacterales bacterium]|nr:DUF3305 domain-containing protein [Rhodobacterales bacterium]